MEQGTNTGRTNSACVGVKHDCDLLCSKVNHVAYLTTGLCELTAPEKAKLKVNYGAKIRLVFGAKLVVSFGVKLEWILG